MALMHSTMSPLGSSAKAFELTGTDGRQYSLESFAEREALVIIFMCNHCPYVKAVLDRLITLQNDYKDRNVQLVGINSNDTVKYPDDSMENMANLVIEKNIPFPYLLDETQAVAKSYDAVCTPDFFVYGNQRTLLYRGRMDDNWQEPDKITKNDLRLALDQILEGKEVTGEQVPSMGCSIKWK